MMIKPEEIVDLAKLGIPADEFDYYLKTFPKKGANFALVKVGGDCLGCPEPMYQALAALCKLSLYPVVIHGGGKQLDKAYKAAGIEPKKINGLRVTEKDVLEEIIAPELSKVNAALVEGIEQYGGSAVGLTTQAAILAKKKPEETGLGYVGDVTDVNISLIEAAVADGKIPVMWCLGYENDQILNVNADSVAVSLANTIQFQKFLMLSCVGGVLDSDGKVVSELHYSKVSGINATGGMALKLDEAVGYLAHLEQPYGIQIASPENLLAELFTLKGKGTFVHNSNLKYSHHTSFEGLNKPKLKTLIEDALGSELVPDYFNATKPSSVLLCTTPRGEYVGVFVLQEQSAVPGAAYIDKMAVAQGYRGNGIGETLMSNAKDTSEKLFWRADPKKHANNGWFHTKYGTLLGMQGGWNIYHVGLGTDGDENAAAMGYAANKPKTI